MWKRLGVQGLDHSMRHWRRERSPHTTGRLAGSPDQARAIVTGAAAEDEASRRFLLQVVQPGLAGLMDGSVSTLAPIFATAWLSQKRSPMMAHSLDAGAPSCAAASPER